MEILGVGLYLDLYLLSTGPLSLQYEKKLVATLDRERILRFIHIANALLCACNALD